MRFFENLLPESFSRKKKKGKKSVKRAKVQVRYKKANRFSHEDLPKVEKKKLFNFVQTPRLVSTANMTPTPLKRRPKAISKPTSEFEAFKLHFNKLGME